ncbi:MULTISPECIES: LysE family translocator [unclassified Halomonas]|uniref:LysE family translocator n=1 Tax=unclassified Halomonas TaxID=2609666 RepID=UPI0007D9084B|nr:MULTISPECIES: LysE family translocator [unclassified Halomonas]MBT2787778.1 LysE family translocator [Halomonas sp. ISL-106]MBT2799611.1 LysE family translocator [Halomonas sp. ISL-104]OAL61428.1 hypothetical protein A6R74_14550 [Halomonas sp. ALS9]
MDGSVIAAFSVVSAMSIASPGPAIVLAIKNGITSNYVCASFGILGNALALLILSSASIMGLSAILASSSMLFSVTKVAGAIYLIYLGGRYLLQNRGKSKAGKAFSEYEENLERSYWEYFREAFLLAIINPKPILFFGALFPQFINFDQPVFPQFTVLTGIFICISIATLHMYSGLARKAKKILAKPKALEWMERTTGIVLIGFGFALLALPSSQ